MNIGVMIELMCWILSYVISMLFMIDEGMTNGPLTFAYLVFSPGGVSFERFTRPMKASARCGSAARLGVQAKLRGVQIGLVLVFEPIRSVLG
jgi:hypothetical protein